MMKFGRFVSFVFCAIAFSCLGLLVAAADVFGTQQLTSNITDEKEIKPTNGPIPKLAQPTWDLFNKGKRQQQLEKIKKEKRLEVTERSSVDDEKTRLDDTKGNSKQNSMHTDQGFFGRIKSFFNGEDLSDEKVKEQLDQNKLQKNVQKQLNLSHKDAKAQIQEKEKVFNQLLREQNNLREEIENKKKIFEFFKTLHEGNPGDETIKSQLLDIQKRGKEDLVKFNDLREKVGRASIELGRAAHDSQNLRSKQTQDFLKEAAIQNAIAQKRKSIATKRRVGAAVGAVAGAAALAGLGVGIAKAVEASSDGGSGNGGQQPAGNGG